MVPGKLFLWIFNIFIKVIILWIALYFAAEERAKPLRGNSKSQTNWCPAGIFQTSAVFFVFGIYDLGTILQLTLQTVSDT
jgi:hypothetical protein